MAEGLDSDELFEELESLDPAGRGQNQEKTPSNGARCARADSASVDALAPH